MTYKLIKERATAAGIRDAYFLKIYANDTMIEIKPARESMTEQEMQNWFDEVIYDHRNPSKPITILTKSYED
jgi:hypothetical protein